MTYENVATILNSASALLPLNGSDTPITVLPDLSNLSELGTAISDLTSDQLKNFQKNLVVGVYNDIIGRTLGRVEFGFTKTTEKYGGALQRIVGSSLLDAQDSHILNLSWANGKDYHDGKFYGVPVDARIFEDTDVFKVAISFSEDTFMNYFTNASELANYMGYLAIIFENSINKKLNTWECNLVSRVINESPNRISLTENFNKEILGIATTSTTGYKTLADIIKDKDLFGQWANYCKSVIEVLISRISDVTLGDGLTTPVENIRVILNQKFESFIKNMANSYLFNVSDFPAHKTVNAWNVSENVTLTDSGTTSAFTTNILGGNFNDDNANFLAYIKNGDSTHDGEYVEGVVGLIYDSDCAGITLRADKTTIEEVGAEGFRTVFRHIGANMYCDPRFKTFVITL